MKIRADVAALQLAVQRSKTDTDAATAQADRRGREQAADAERQAAALVKRLESLSSTLAALTGRVEELNTKVEAVNRQLRTSAVPRPGGAPSAPAPPAPGTAPPSGAARPTTGSLQPPDIYQSAYLDFSKGSYALAIAGFREFLRRFPDHELAGNSQYWIAEAHYSLARGYLNAAQADKAAQALEQAVTEFRKVVANYPRGEKVPAALLKEALALIDLKQPALAQARLQYLIDNFPQAEETPLARDRLSSLKGS